MKVIGVGPLLACIMCCGGGIGGGDMWDGVDDGIGGGGMADCIGCCI